MVNGKYIQQQPLNKHFNNGKNSITKNHKYFQKAT